MFMRDVKMPWAIWLYMCVINESNIPYCAVAMGGISYDTHRVDFSQLYTVDIYSVGMTFVELYHVWILRVESTWYCSYTDKHEHGTRFNKENKFKGRYWSIILVYKSSK